MLICIHLIQEIIKTVYIINKRNKTLLSLLLPSW